MEGETVIERRSWAEKNLNELRKFLIQEPRGHADMYGGFIVPPDDKWRFWGCFLPCRWF